MTLTIGSLFSGIGGLEKGLEAAGLGPVVWQVEQSEFCRRILAKHWPDAERFDDVRTVGASVLRRVDVICGGFPCQPVSLAGRGLAQADERWLWPEFARLVAEVRPRFVVIENVPGLVWRGLAEVVSGLSNLGYAVVGTRLAAADLGAPHERERVFLVAHANGEGLEGTDERRETFADASGRSGEGAGVGGVRMLRGGEHMCQIHGRHTHECSCPEVSEWRVNPYRHKPGKLNPRWVEWLMGFPIDWTDWPVSEMPLFRNAPRSSDDSSETSQKDG